MRVLDLFRSCSANEKARFSELVWKSVWTIDLNEITVINQIDAGVDSAIWKSRSIEDHASRE